MRRLIVILLLAASAFAQPPSPTSAGIAPKVRAITAFVRLDRVHYRQQIAEALQFLRSAQSAYQKAGLEVETIRITTQPFPEVVRGVPEGAALAFFRELDQLAAKES